MPSLTKPTPTPAWTGISCIYLGTLVDQYVKDLEEGAGNIMSIVLDDEGYLADTDSWNDDVARELIAARGSRTN